MNRPINNAPFRGFPAGTLELVAIRSRRPPWYRRLWDWLRGRASAWRVTHSFRYCPEDPDR